MKEALLQYERIVLGAILQENQRLLEVNLSAGDFGSTAHARIYGACCRIIGQGDAADPWSVAEALHEESGEAHWLRLASDAVGACLAPSNAAAYAERVRQASRSRKAVAIGRRLERGGVQAIAEAIRELGELSAASQTHSCHVGDAVTLASHELDARLDGVDRGVLTGIADLDEALGGLHAQDLIVIAARPAMGKTAFMLNLCLAANVGVGVISAEQGRVQIGMRVMAMEGRINLHHMRTRKLGSEDWPRLTDVREQMRDRPIWIFDKPAPSIDEVLGQARAWQRHHGIGMLMIDYLQKIQGGRGESFRLQLGDVAARLKALARELDIPVVALAQVKRDVESREMARHRLGRMPQMSDIAEASLIEQEADQIITLYRPAVYDHIQPEVAYFNICKNRHGPVGCKAMNWQGEFLRFSSPPRP